MKKRHERERERERERESFLIVGMAHLFGDYRSKIMEMNPME